jgi:hypothetical protein
MNVYEEAHRRLKYIALSVAGILSWTPPQGCPTLYWTWKWMKLKNRSTAR